MNLRTRARRAPLACSFHVLQTHVLVSKRGQEDMFKDQSSYLIGSSRSRSPAPAAARLRRPVEASEPIHKCHAMQRFHIESHVLGPRLHAVSVERPAGLSETLEEHRAPAVQAAPCCNPPGISSRWPAGGSSRHTGVRTTKAFGSTGGTANGASTFSMSMAFQTGA